MRDILFKAKAINRDKGYHRTKYKNGDWVYGLITRLYDERFKNLPAEMTDLSGVSGIEIDHNTICQYTGLNDNHGNKIWENDVVEFLGYKGKIVFECGCFGIGSKITIDWDKISDNIFPITGCNNFLKACENDNFISLWEIYWNFNEEENCIYMIDTIGNIFDSPELLEGSGEDD